jgi:hypothetical protein
MEKLLEKISAYQFLNYLIPGLIFVYAIEFLGIYDLQDDNEFLMLFGGYFAGMVMSRIGSLIFEKKLLKWKFIEFAPYKDFKKAESKDSKITILSTENNTYRTLFATFFVLFVTYGISLIPCVSKYMHSKWMWLVILALLCALFLFSYRKQTTFVRKSVEYYNQNNQNQ